MVGALAACSSAPATALPPPTITITSPAPDAHVAATGDLPVTFAVGNFTLREPGACNGAPACGHVEIFVDGAACNRPGLPFNGRASELTATAKLSACPSIIGNHTISLRLHHDDYTPVTDAAGHVILSEVTVFDSGGLYCPTDYSLTPPLTATATTHSYPHADQVRDPAKDYLAVLETDVGRIVWRFRPTAPLATNSYVFLALHHFFDGIAFHRVVPQFLAQAGDPNTLGSDRSTWGYGGPGYKFADELVPPPTYPPYVVASANSGNANGSQFFITTGTASHVVTPIYTVFGDVIEGMDVLGKLAPSPDPGGWTPPDVPTRIKELHVCER